MSYGDGGDILPHDDTIYRISIDPETNAVEISCIGINRLDTALKDTYVSVDALPTWAKEKLAVLMMLRGEGSSAFCAPLCR